MTRWTEAQLQDWLAHGRRAQKAVWKITEKAWQAQVKELAQTLGWRVYHTYDSRKSDPGFPDLLMLRRGRIVVAELKVSDNKLTPAQEAWVEDFRELAERANAWPERVNGWCVVEVFVWRPEDLEEVKAVLE